MSLLNYIVRRLLFMILVLFGVLDARVRVLMLIPPGMRVAAYVTSEKVTPEQVDAMIQQYGLTGPGPRAVRALDRASSSAESSATPSPRLPGAGRLQAVLPRHPGAGALRHAL